MYRIKLVFIFCFITSISFSQSENKIDVNIDIDIVKVYKQVVKEGYGTPSVYKDLANATYFRSEYTESKKWFEILFKEVKVTDPILIFRYNQSLKALGLYKKAIEQEETVASGANR
tara:strand:- start:2098 stop:2445 length:348 start_codon:yes stop_codon:yes gene_type:complete